MKTRPCILCGTETKGSIGAAGLKWNCICQKCKDIEDNYLKESLKITQAIQETFGFGDVSCSQAKGKQ